MCGIHSSQYSGGGSSPLRLCVSDRSHMDIIDTGVFMSQGSDFVDEGMPPAWTTAWNPRGVGEHSAQVPWWCRPWL